jgi:hypothetical protein
MRRLRIGIVDLVARAPTTAIYARVMNANYAAFMPQAVAVWCEEAGHDVHLVVYTGFEDFAGMLRDDVDILFLNAFSQSAQLAYAVSRMYRQRGVVTAIGGPHARCYPEDCARFFDYVFGFTDKPAVLDVLSECAPAGAGPGRQVSASRQPAEVPSLQARWRHVETTLEKAPLIKIVPMISSLGCPYACSFCIDSTVGYQPLDLRQLGDDLRFLLTKHRNPIVGWHDPNFGIRFDEIMQAVAEADPQHRIRHIAESTLAVLTEPHLRTLRENGFRATLPGIESWYDMGNKSMTRRTGMDKVEHVAEQLNLVLRYIPYLQTNFVMGLDCDEGDEPYELTKRFLDLVPGAFPAFSLLTAFGRAAPVNLDYQRAGRLLPVPHHFLNNNHAMNVRPLHFDWPSFYDRVVDLTTHAFSGRAIRRRLTATPTLIPKWMNLVRAMSSEGWGRIRYHRMLRGLLDTDAGLRAFLEGETRTIPQFYANRIERELGPMWAYLPPGAMEHDELAYSRSEASLPPPSPRAGQTMPGTSPDTDRSAPL